MFDLGMTDLNANIQAIMKANGNIKEAALIISQNQEVKSSDNSSTKHLST
jgi:hypothetical protein